MEGSTAAMRPFLEGNVAKAAQALREFNALRMIAVIFPFRSMTSAC
jgi:hypothetical protein